MKNIKEKIEKLRQEAEDKIEEVNRLEASIPLTEQNKVAKQLHKRFRKLEDGFEIKWQPTSPFVMPMITSTIQWFSDDEPEYDQDIDAQVDHAVEEYRYTLHSEWEEWIEKHPQVSQMKRDIKTLCNESDRQAKKFGVEKMDFFEMVMTGDCS